MSDADARFGMFLFGMLIAFVITEDLPLIMICGIALLIWIVLCKVSEKRGRKR